MLVALIMDYIKFLGSHLSLAIEIFYMNGLVDFMNSNPHGGHAFNEVWLVALVATCTPYVKLATKEVSCLFCLGFFVCHVNLLSNHDKVCKTPYRWRSNLFL